MVVDVMIGQLKGGTEIRVVKRKDQDPTEVSETMIETGATEAKGVVVVTLGVLPGALVEREAVRWTGWATIWLTRD